MTTGNLPQHTPGPWKVVDSHTSNDSLTITTADGRHYIGLTGLKDKPEHVANARLIAAAPDMLAALREAHEFLDFECGDGSAGHVRDIIKDAIAKAEGHTP